MPRKRSTSILLEGKHKTDDAWRDCEVFLTSTGHQTILKVRYSGLEDNEEDNIITANEARSRLRPRSKMLGNGQCLQLQEGDVVLASRRSESGKIHFFDARIEKVERQKHSVRVSCKCSFELMWLDSTMKGETCTVTASQVHQINQSNIQDHPIIFEWLKSVRPEDGHQPEPSDIGSDVQAQLEEEIDKIAMMADTLDKDCSAEELPATSLADVRQSSRRKAPARKRSAKGNLGSSAEVPNARTSSRKRTQSIATSSAAVLDDETLLTLPSPFNKRPRLSPLAARAALAAAVQTIPLGQASCETSSVFLTKPMEKQTQKKAGAARKRLNSRFLVEDDDDIKISESLCEIKTSREPKEQGKWALRRGAAKKRDSSLCSPAAVSFERSNFLSPIKESLLENQWETPSVNISVNKTSTPRDTLRNTMLRERTNRSSKVDEKKYLATRETAEVAAKKVRRKGSEMSSLRSSARLRKENDICATPLPEPNDGMHSTVETKYNNTSQPKSEAIEPDGGVSSSTKRTKTSMSSRSSRSKMSSRATSATEGKSVVDEVGLPTKATERRTSSEITSEEDKVQGTKVIDSKEESSRKRQPIKQAIPNKKSKAADLGPLSSDTLQLEEDKNQTTLREDMPMPAATIDVTVELVTDIQNNGDTGKNSSPHRLKLRTRKVSFDALPVGFGLGITGWLPSPSPAPEPLQTQHTPPPCEVDPERGRTVDLHIEASDLINTAMQNDGQKNKKTGKKKAAALPWKSQGRSKNRVAGASNVNENERLASNVGKEVMFASVLVQSSPCYGGKVQPFSSSKIKQQLGEAMWSSSPACVNPGKKSAKSILVSVFSGQNHLCESGATSVATVKRESGKRSKRSTASVLPLQDVEQGLETTHQPDGDKNVSRASDRPAKRTRKMAAL